MLWVAMAALLLMAPTTAAVDDEEAAARLLSLVNAARAERGLAPVCPDPLLEEAARENTQRMVRERRLRHSSAARLRRLGAGGVAENVGFAADPDTLHRLLLASRGHRANLLGPFNRIGIVAARGRDGLLYATFVFASGARESGQ